MQCLFGRAADVDDGIVSGAAMGQRREEHIGGTRVLVEGAGPPLVLLHGVGLDLTMWGPQAAALTPHFTVVRYDFWGHGESEDPPGPRSLDDLVEQLTAVLTALALPRVALVGFSLGGLVARGFVARHWQRLERLVLMNTIAARDPSQLSGVRDRLAQAEHDGPASIIDAAIRRWFSAGFLAQDPPIAAAIRRRLEANRPEAFLKCYRIYGLSDGAVPVPPPARGLPMLALTAEDDLNSTPEMARDLAAAFDQGQVAVIPGLRHLAHLEDPALVNRVLLDFLLRDTHETRERGAS